MRPGIMRKNLLIKISTACMLFGLVSCGGGGGGGDGSNDQHQQNIPASWSAADLLETDTGNATSPSIAVSDDGSAIAVWTQDDGTRFNVWANRFDGTTWGVATLIEDHIGQASNPKVAMDADGKAVAVWDQTDLDYNGFRNDVWANRFDGTSWGSPELIEASDENVDGYGAKIAMISDGRALVVWNQGGDIWANGFDGMRWQAAEMIEESFHRVWELEIAMAPNGHAVAVWQHDDDRGPSIYSNHFDGASWGNTEMIEQDPNSSAEPQVAITKDGKAMAIWSGYDGTQYYIGSNHFDGSAWGGVELLQTVTTSIYCLKLAMDADGRAQVIWNQEENQNFIVLAKRFDGSSWGDAEQIGTRAWMGFIADKLVVNASGEAVLVWHDGDPSFCRLWAIRFNGQSWGAAEPIVSAPTIVIGPDPITPYTTYDSPFTSGSCAMDTHGNAFAVWDQYYEEEQVSGQLIGYSIVASHSAP